MAIDIIVHRDRVDIERLGPQWADLYARCSHGSPAQSPAYGLLAIEHATPPAARLSVITAWRAGVMVGIWPLWLVPDYGFAIARHISGGSNEEYGGPLAENGDVLLAMLNAARREADALHLCNLPADSACAKLLHGVTTHRTPILSPVMRCGQSANLAGWLAGKSDKFRQNMRREARSLNLLGAICVAQVDHAKIDEFVEWLFDTKSAWVSAKGITRSWVTQTSARNFYKSALKQNGEFVRGYAIKLNEAYIAGSISLHGAAVEYFIATHDPAYTAYAPGNILRLHVTEQAISEGLDLDLRISHEEFKLRWMDEMEQRVTITAINRWRAWPILMWCHVVDARRSVGMWRRRIVARLKMLRLRPAILSIVRRKQASEQST